jgi:hypothetical protein
METYRELEKELAEVCLMNESDQDSISIYLDRFTALAATGTLSDAQFDRLNGYIEELILNWGDEN